MDNVSKSSLRKRMINAGGWVASVFVFGQILRFASNLIMTRLLVPEMFGVMAVVTVVQVGLTMFSDVGLLQNIVKSRRGEEPSFLNTVWVVQIVRGFFLFFVMLLLSWFLVVVDDFGWLSSGSVYADPVLPSVLMAMALNVVITGLSSTKRYTAVRWMNLSRVSLLELASQFAGVVVMIALAWLEPNIWSLVIGSLVTSVSATALSYLMLPGLANRLQWDSSAFHELFNFGKWIFLSSIVSFLGRQGDRLIFGGLVSSAVLGVYSIAFFLASAVRLLLDKVNGMVFFPALSEVVRDRSDDLSDAYYRIRWRIDGVAFFVSGFLMATGQLIIDLLYDARYHEAGWMLQMIAISLISVGYLSANQCFLALGKTKQMMQVNVVQAVVLIGGMIPAFWLFGMVGSVLVVALSPLVGGVVAFWFMHRFGLLQAYREFQMLPMLFVGFVLGEALIKLLG